MLFPNAIHITKFGYESTDCVYDLGSKFFYFLGDINSAENFKQYSSSLVSFAQLGSVALSL